jgi:hypothetical protein
MKYDIIATYTASKLLGTVEANSREEAIERGYELDSRVSLCPTCAQGLDIGDCDNMIAEPQVGKEQP